MTSTTDTCVMEILAIIAGVIAGIGSGFLSAVLSPFAQRRAEETRTKRQERRRLIAEGRSLVAEARSNDWGFFSVGADPRYLAMRPHLPESVQNAYVPVSSLPMPQAVSQLAALTGPPNHEPLSRAIDDLERQWKLI